MQFLGRVGGVYSPDGTRSLINPKAHGPVPMFNPSSLLTPPPRVNVLRSFPSPLRASLRTSCQHITDRATSGRKKDDEEPSNERMKLGWSFCSCVFFCNSWICSYRKIINFSIHFSSCYTPLLIVLSCFIFYYFYVILFFEK